MRRFLKILICLLMRRCERCYLKDGMAVKLVEIHKPGLGSYDSTFVDICPRCEENP